MNVIGAIPHQYVWVDSQFTHLVPCGFVPAVWFGLVSLPSRMWGCNILFESGAIYRNLPLHALAACEQPESVWTARDAQTWDCYGYEFSVLAYPYLAELVVRVKANQRIHKGMYLFTAAPYGDGFSAVPEQGKEFSFIELDNGRYTVQPTNHVLVEERSFTRNPDCVFPTGLKRQTEVYSCETGDVCLHKD